jgi:hypothetical protein
MVIDWQEGFDRISRVQGWTPRDERLPLIGSTRPLYVHSVMLTPISGPGQPAHPEN